MDFLARLNSKNEFSCPYYEKVQFVLIQRKTIFPTNASHEKWISAPREMLCNASMKPSVRIMMKGILVQFNARNKLVDSLENDKQMRATFKHEKWIFVAISTTNDERLRPFQTTKQEKNGELFFLTLVSNFVFYWEEHENSAIIVKLEMGFRCSSNKGLLEFGSKLQTVSMATYWNHANIMTS